MFRASQRPSSGARLTLVAASGFCMNVEVEVFSADHGWEHFHLHILTETRGCNGSLTGSWLWALWCPKHVEQCLYDKAINFTNDCCIYLVVLFEWWTHSRPKHVEKRNKYAKKNCARSRLYLQDYYTEMHGQQNIKKIKWLLLAHNRGRVTQICVFNTVKLGTSASSP